MGHDSVFLHSFYRKAVFRLIFRSNWAKLKDGLPDSIMVVRQILVLFVLVRIQVGQQAPLAIARGVFVFIMKLPFETVDLHSFSLLAGNLLYLRVGKPGCAEIIVIPEVHDPHVIAPAAIRGRRIKLQ